MMRLLGRFIDLAEAALAAGVEPERIAALGCLRALQRMGEEIADDELAAPGRTRSAPGARIRAARAASRHAGRAHPPTEARDAAHG